MYYSRKLEKNLIKGLNNNPVTAVIGPRQCGKTTLVKHIINNIQKEVVYLDLERPSDLQKLEYAEWFLTKQKNKLICLDEIQRKPELFPLIRSLIDEWGGNTHFLILGSATRELIKQSSESLAGRITYKQLTPFLFNEIKQDFTIEDYMVKGGFPRSLMKMDSLESFEWREDFITTFLERDLLMWSGFSTETMRKLWLMIAHLNGQIVNYHLIASSLGISAPTVKNYIELLSSTFMVRLLPPFIANTGKRLVKSPKIYLTDTGITNALMGITNFNQLAGLPSLGAAWESLVFANLTGNFQSLNFYFYRTNHGAELDLIIESKGKIIAVECKAGTTPVLSRGSYTAISDLKPLYTFIVSPVKSGWSVKPGVDVVSLEEVIQRIGDTFGLPKV